MELILNLAWGLLAVYLLTAWWKQREQNAAYSCGAHRMDPRTQLIALCVILIVLFPVISVSDDLFAAQFPAVTDSNNRKCHSACCSAARTLADSTPFEAAAVFQFQTQQLSFVALPALPARASANNPALFKIENRPPPVIL